MKKLKLFVILSLLMGSMFAFAACGADELSVPKGWEIDEENTLFWDEVTDARSYVVEIKNVADGTVTEMTPRKTEADLSKLEEGDYEIKIKASMNPTGAFLSLIL